MNDSDRKSGSPAKTLSPAREVWFIAWPTVMTMTSYTIMQFMDSLMVGQVGPLEVAAQGNGGIWTFVPLATMFGFITVVNTYVSQNLGAGTPEKGPKYAWAGLWMSIIMWMLVLLPMAMLLPWIMFHSHDPQTVEHFDKLVRLESGYGQILLVGGIITLAARTLHHYFFGLHRPRLITVSALVGNSVNAIMNFILIFGEQGLPQFGLPGIPGTPALGLYGAAIGTVIGTTFEFAIPMAVFLGPKMNRELRTRSSWRPSLKPMKELFRLGWPAAWQYGNELICWAIFMTVLVGSFGEHHMTAGWIALRYMHLSFMPAVGFSVAATSLVGKYIGAGQPEVAADRARLTLRLAVVYMTICGLIFFLFRSELVGLFVGGTEVSPEARAEIISIGAKLMICAAVFQTADAFGIVYMGALRGAGDTVWPGLMTMIYSWVFIVGGGIAMTYYWPELQSIGPWIGASVYIILLGFTMLWRFEKGAWRSIKLLGVAEREAAGIAPIGPGAPAASAESSYRDLAQEVAESVSESIPKE